MGNDSPVPLSKFRSFLKSQGLTLQRTKGDHEMWNRKDNPFLRPIVIQTKYKEIPFFAVKTNLNTMGISLKVFCEKIKDC